MLTSLLQDLRHSLRLMVRAPGFTVAALLMLALAIGATTAVFSIVYGVLLRPLPYPDASHIVRLSEEHPGGVSIIRDDRLSNLTFDAWSASPLTIDAMAAYSSDRYIVDDGKGIERIEGAAISPSAVSLLGMVPTLGRGFRPEEAATGSDGVIILSDGLWRTRFGGDHAVIGRVVLIDGRPHEVIGVAAPEFYFPDRDARFWKPYVLPTRTANGTSMMSVLARLKPGVTAQQAAAEGTAAARSVTRPISAELLLGKGGPVEVRVRALDEAIARRVRPALLVLSAAVALVLVIACANVANLLLARGTSRSRELAVRAALGAGGARLARQLLTESAVLAVLGGVAGVFLAWGFVRAMPAWAPEGFPRIADVRLDGRVLGFAALLSALAGGLAGVFPAWRASRIDLTPALRDGDGRSVGAGARVRSALLAFEAALSVVLLVGAALLGRSFVALVNVDPGYDPANVLTGRVYVTGAVATPERRQQFVQALAERLRSAPGVVAAGVGNMAPLGESSFVSGFAFGVNESGQQIVARALQYVVTAGYAEALGLRLKEGRFLQPADETAPVQAMLVNDAFVRAYVTDGKSVVGRRYRGLLGSDQVTTEIVGVVGDVLKDGLDTKAQGEVYLAHGPGRGIRREINVVIRTAGDPDAFAPTLRSLVRDLEPAAAVDRVGTLSRSVAESVGEPRFATTVLGMFAALALAIAAAGLYGVLSYNVTQRRRELGIRAALGATRGRVMSMVIREGLTVTGVGLLAGLLASVLVARRLEPLLFGVQPLDAVSFGMVPLVLLGVAAVACTIPARRAAATDPASTLRSD
jgi:putative ABC transport system permease protein